MVQHKTILKIIDNSGAKTAQCIRVLGGYKKKQAISGDLILVSIKSLKTKINKLNIKTKTVFLAMLIKTKIMIEQKLGFKQKFKNHNIILLDKQKNPLGTRINGFVSKKLKIKFYKLISISLSFI